MAAPPAMTSDDILRALRLRAAAEDHDQELQSLLHQTYRQLEHAYHCSPEYGRMVERYPVLAQAIARCRYADLVGDPPEAPAAGSQSCRRPPSPLHWDRRHGEI